jgi:anti-sigma-K factor RskA
MHAHDAPHPDVAGFLLGSLDDEEAQAFGDHLASCDACRHELSDLAELPGLLADVPSAEHPPADLEGRTFAAIEAAAQDPDGRLDREPEGAHNWQPPEPGARVVPIEQARRHRRRRIGLAAVAAVAVVALAVGVIGSLRTSSAVPIATIRLVAVNGGPAHAVATVRRSKGGETIDMQVAGLPPSPAGTMYTCWLVGPGDTLAHQNRVSVGSFVVGGNRSLHVTWTTAADMQRFPHLGVTLEPANGDPRHQGPKVLAGP